MPHRPEPLAANAHGLAWRVERPLVAGQVRIEPRRPLASWAAASRDEQLGLLDLVQLVQQQLDLALQPDGYTLTLHTGAAAPDGRLVIDLLPRFAGEGEPAQPAPEPLSTGGEADPFSAHVLPLLARSTEVTIVSAFVQESGLDRIRHALHTALDRGARVRLLTGDYLDITQASALERLYDWQSTWREGEGADSLGLFECRVIEVHTLPGRTRTFHPKSWHLSGEGFGVAFVGSSNLSRAALDTGIEWNLRVDRFSHPRAWERVRQAADAIWQLARPLTADWIDAYARRARARPLPPSTGEPAPDSVAAPVSPHEVQREALAALRRSREEGRRRALVVLATGLGKTWLAAFDYEQMWAELGRQPRLLFVAHRREILRQAAQRYRQIASARGGDTRVGWFVEDQAQLDAHLVFASIAKLSRPAYADRLAAAAVDILVIDEVHHATADSYRRVLGAVGPAFVLGLTATPDRADAADVIGLLDDHVAYRADIGRGIAIGRLVPFRYFGVKDDIDYDNIPWRNRRFDPEALAAAAQTTARMATLWAAWEAHPAARTLVFCCSVAHTDFVCDWLRAQGVRVAKVYAAPGSDDRDAALEQLEAGALDAVCAVDVFNEGIDLPGVDRVVMLRPTESGVIFLQQLGRGLRAAPDKAALTVIDFVGNHPLFLDRLRTLLSLGSDTPGEALRRLIAEGHLELPAGCAVALELEAKPLLEARFRAGGVDEVERVYRQLRAQRGARPTAGELLRRGYAPSSIQRRHGSFFAFVQTEGDLPPTAQAARTAAASLLEELETGDLARSYALIPLQVLLDAEALFTGLPLADHAAAALSLLRRSPELLRDVPDDQRLPDDPSPADLSRWTAWWRTEALSPYLRPRPPRRPHLTLDPTDRLRLSLPVDPAWAPALTALIAELVDLRTVQLRRRATLQLPEGFVCKVTWNQRDPILKLPSRKTLTLPQGEVDVRLPDGALWQFRFAAEFCNVARPLGAGANQLPDLLRRWFGPRAGQPGTQFFVRLSPSPDGLWMEPLQSPALSLLPRRGVVAYPDLRAAAGHAIGATEPPDAARVWLPLDEPDPSLFAVRVAGTSMDGGRAPLRDGDWALFRLSRGAPAAAVVNRVVLVQVPGDGGSAYQIKRVVRVGPGWRLTSDNPDGPTFPGTEETVVIATLERGLRPEDLAPAVGPVEDLEAAFGIEGLPPRSGIWGGHRFVFLSEAGALAAPDRLRAPPPGRPGETVFVLAPVGAGLRYLGVGRWREAEGAWSLPEVDFATWRAWGAGSSVSRELPEGALARAEALVAAVLARPEAERVLDKGGGRTAQVLGASARGGLRVRVGDGERTVSLVDLAWVIVAAEDVAARGGLLDEARVNRLRYLEGTPKGSTRWIDTGWALVVVRQSHNEQGPANS